jgi:hypothetical protein
MTDTVNDELRVAVDDIFGTDTESWKSIGLFDAVTKIVARTNNRIFVGLPLCTRCPPICSLPDPLSSPYNPTTNDTDRP